MMTAPTGILLVDKSPGQTSAQAVGAMRRLFGGAKAGHAGTLDPMATGLLTMLLGEAASFARFMRSDKMYLAEVKFGEATDTEDACGQVVSHAALPPQWERRLEEALPRFVGDTEQTAPMHSALKYRGKPLYYYARRGLSAPAKRRPVRVYELRLESASDHRAVLFIHCGGGFYVRSLARDLGEILGCGAHLSALRRLHCAPFDVAQAYTVDAWQKLPTTAQKSAVLPIESALQHLPAKTIDGLRLRALAHGRREEKTDVDGESALVRLLSASGRFAGVALAGARWLLPQKMLSWTREN